jgi:hypothetical protein
MIERLDTGLLSRWLVGLAIANQEMIARHQFYSARLRLNGFQ